MDFWKNLKFDLAGVCGELFIRILLSTVHIELHNYEVVRNLNKKNIPVIFSFWHGRMLFAAYNHRNRNIGIMISRNVDGEYIHRIVNRLGYISVRGSSSRGGAPALMEMLDLIQQGFNTAITPDGPRGPRYIVQKGIIYLAMKSGKPIIPIGIASESSWEMKSWDNFCVPKPYSLAHAQIGKPFYVPCNLDEKGVEKYRLKLQKEMWKVSSQAEAYFGYRFEKSVDIGEDKDNVSKNTQ